MNLSADVKMDPAGSGGLHIEFPSDLPISAHVDAIRAHLRSSQVLVVAGETGSGKTTQLPKICIAAGYGKLGMIGHTQPRRLAARAVAARIAEETRSQLGAAVGYAVRFNDVVSADTRIKIVTDGLLLTEIRRDKLLSRYEVIIVDEAHERSLNIDFLLGYLQGVLERRADLRLIITSATIDVAAFSSHFRDAPIVEVSGRSYPVTVEYLDDALAASSAEERLLGALEEIESKPRTGARDVLVFLPGEREIMECARFLRETAGQRFEILPLYARLSAAEQQKIFATGRLRRVVLATNVAETSLTVPNIGFVVDFGTARVSRYSFRSKLQRLSLEPVSQASADQRAGRCGRIAPGTCLRLYTREDFESRPAYTDPEIQRTNLAAVVLQMRAFGLGDPKSFPFLEPPDPRAIRDAENLLAELGALTGERLTDLGRMMARIPVDPRLARMLIAADRTRALTEMLVIVSALASADARERPLHKQGSADQAHAQWADQRSDFLTLLRLWNWFEERRQQLTRAALRRELGRNFLSVSRMHEWRALHRQLLLVARELKLKPNGTAADYASVHQALLPGSLSLIGRHEERGEYLGPRNLRFRIFPGSALSAKTPKWLVCGEIVETSRVYARQVAGVEPRWIEEAAAHLVKKSHSEPHWSIKRGEAVAYETVTL
ncbi:MAG: ATP-dependent RNA helicase HrpA, partial [Pseudomonadales bacterium]|nr:ATP-dependent RNA helicase HrpA [Pseudomonadales bacterium]